ncbi:single-stranded DNA-binding protein [Thermoleptolyngbya oregonensis NK1-22]|jgi:single-stranded DNA-binding protein|uniref:Single-stranded DNA-binding protein n=1 Tax=Thermoleptolyngbya oregonensis NK1-22 TaxID=2547457 RepID=A0AA97BMW8_9CYAN|nr:single-stranded DNA-binding protein [Thermoleptolyngbya sichuanensis]MDG2616922.1 single-stranded DNA-binding protein [Thermoleptolyngbya sichuanensis XZ-Cy5]WOB44787.1 single-stranded DNA-binding protein [Thermoleptolyngbya oregonensis NK1-22]
MNNCILMAEVIQEPQLRYTSDSQTPIAEMTVQFAALRDNEPPGQIKVVGWGNLAQEIQAGFHVGDRVILEGRLGMNMIDRPEGFKEKRAELTVSRIHRIEADASLKSSTADVPGTAASRPAATTPAAPPAYAASTAKAAPAAKAPVETADYDDIPF